MTLSTCVLAGALSHMACQVIEAPSGYDVLPRATQEVSAACVLYTRTKSVPLFAVRGNNTPSNH